MPTTETHPSLPLRPTHPYHWDPPIPYQWDPPHPYHWDPPPPLPLRPTPTPATETHPQPGHCDPPPHRPLRPTPTPTTETHLQPDHWGPPPTTPTIVLSPGDVTQQATWRPPCGVRRVIQKRSQLYTKKSNVSRKFLYGLSMSSSPNLNIHLLWVFFSFKGNRYILLLLGL